ncbi:MAG: GtrA family protein [Paludibacteraceae bacterium]|nr:GtrA family protein [Paludibacteraceae bacterium]MBR1480651.1 GtrA family protein [Paludibacteraceae bacterium]
MKLPTSYLPPETRSVVRFLIIGNLGTCIQYGLYYGFIKLFPHMGWEGDLMVSFSFTLAYLLEIIYNYLGTSYYTFQSKPNLKNAGGFALARVFNYFLQMGLLALGIQVLNMSDAWGGAFAILVAGVVNFFIMRVVFREEKIRKIKAWFARFCHKDDEDLSR